MGLKDIKYDIPAFSLFFIFIIIIHYYHYYNLTERTVVLWTPFYFIIWYIVFFLSGGLLEYWFTTCWLGFHPSRLVVMQSSKRSKLTKWSFRKNMWVARVERSVQQRLQLILSCLEDIKRSSRFCKCTSGKGGFFLYTTYIKINNSGSHEKDWNSSWCQRSDGAPLLPRNGLVRFWAGTGKPGIPGATGVMWVGGVS